MKWGISSRHGGHQVAQKSTRTTFPFSASSEIVRPSRVVTSIAGAGFGAAELRGVSATPAASRDAANTQIATIPTPQPITRRRMRSPLEGEPIEEPEKFHQPGQPIAHDQDADCDQEESAGHLHPAQVALEAAEGPEEPSHRGGRPKEREAEPRPAH